MNFFTTIKNKLKEIYSNFRAKLYRLISTYYLRKEQKAAQKLARKNAKMAEKVAKKDFEAKIDEQNEPAEQTELAVPENPCVKNEDATRTKVIAKIKLVSLNFFDVIFEVVFFCAMIFCLIPQIFEPERLIKREIFNLVFYCRSFDESIGYTTFAICVISGLIAVYFFYKSFFAFKMAEGKNKAIALLLLVALVFAGVALSGSDFWIFVVLYLLLFFAFELSCSVKIKSAVKKLIFILLLNFIMSGVILYFFDVRFKDSVTEFVQLILQALNIRK